MTRHQLATELTKREGKKSIVKRGDMLEIIKHLTDIMAEEYVAIGHSPTGKLLSNASLKKYDKAKAKRK